MFSFVHCLGSEARGRSGGSSVPNSIHKLWKRCSLGVLPHKKNQKSKVSIYMGLECKRKKMHLSKWVIPEAVLQANRTYLENKRKNIFVLKSVKS